MSSESEAAVRKNDANPILKTLGKYQIERKLGQGGMGTVYLAKHTDLKKMIALKVLPQDKAKNPTLVRRFKAEAQAAGQLEHPNIVAVYDTGEIDGYLYIAMEYVDGIDLFEYLKRNKVVPVKRSIEIIKEVASALQHAFEQNIVHRDIKPSNLLVRRDGVIKITDLGLARSIDDTLETNITRAGTTVGTVDYMAPEQARNSKSADIRSDIYSLGCTWYQMLTGLPPYPEGSMTNKLHAHSTKPLPDPRDHNENIPEGVLAILQRMTAKRPEDRYQTPAELLEDINHSKLTRAAFSNEIFSDLTDDEVEPKHFTSDEDAEEDDAPEAAPHKRSRVENEVRENSPETGRQKKARNPDSQAGIDNSTKSRGKSPARTRNEEVDPASPNRKKNAGAGAANEKKPSQNAPKALPPKRKPLESDNNQSGGWNLEPLKLFGIIFGVVLLIAGIGWMAFRWSGQFDSQNAPVTKIEAETVVAPPAPPPPLSPVEPVTTNATEKPEAEFDILKAPMPPWASKEPADTKDLPIFAVGPGATTGTHFPNINEALQAADKSGGLLTLLGNGPFLVSSIELKNAKRIVIQAATLEDQPLIIVKAADSKSAPAIRMKNGELDLRGLHFLVDREINPTEVPNSIIAVTDGQLLVRNCSFTATGDGSRISAAMSVTSDDDTHNPPKMEPRVLLDHVVVRGNGLVGLETHRANAEVVIQDSLLATGSAPAISISGHLIPGLAESITRRPRRIIRVLRSTFCGRKHVLDFVAEKTPKPPTTEILFQDSVCSADGAGNSSVLASATRWPSVSSRPSGCWLTNLNWTSVSSLYLGFDPLLELERSSFKVNKPDDWQRVWGAKKFEPNQFQSIYWQESAVAELSSVLPSVFDTSKLPYRDVKSAAGRLPGCAVEGLKVPGVISQSRLFAMSHRPKPPENVPDPSNVIPPRKVDLAKEDLGVILGRNNWESGTTFEASGAGLRSMTPVHIIDKSVRIVFRQLEGGTLKIQPKPTDPKSKLDVAGVFSIENGTLDLQSLTLEISPTTKSPAPQSLIAANNSTVILRNCQLQGPVLQDAERHQALIQWATTETEPGSTGEAPRALSMTDCFLISHGNGINAGCSQGSLFVRNSILATRGIGLNLMTKAGDHSPAPNVDLNHVSFSSFKPAIRVEHAANQTGSPVRLFVDFCAVLPPSDPREGPANESAFLECSESLIESKQIEWWGNSNGVAKEVGSLIQQRGSQPITSPVQWRTAWGDSNDIRLLTGPKGVQLMTSPLPKLVSVKASSYALNPECAGASWADGGYPVGANCKGLEEALIGKKSSKDPKSGPLSKSPAATPTRPPGKPNPGF